MRKQRVILDLCSGLGGWTEAFVQDEWVVVRVENNPALQYVPFTLELDVLKWEEWIGGIPAPEIVVASPPCREFSDACDAPKSIARRAGKPYEPNMEVMKACLDIIDYLKPKYWVLENVRGSQEHFFPIIGARRQKISSFYLWGNFPLIAMPGWFSHRKEENDTWSTDPLRANKRAMIPFEISYALLKVLQGQDTLEKWC
jgi:hypothetical protein